MQGGVEMHCENIYPFFSADVRLRVYRRKPYLTQYSNKDYPNIEFVDLPSTRIKGFEAVFHTFLCVMHILFHRKPQAVHVHNIGPGMFTPLLRLMGLKVVMTYHSAKGLQFRAVFLPCCEEESLSTFSNPLYVAMTRTYQSLYVLYTGRLAPVLQQVPSDLYENDLKTRETEVL